MYFLCQGDYLFGSFGLSVCPTVQKTTKNVMNRFSINFQDMMGFFTKNNPFIFSNLPTPARVEAHCDLTET